MNRTGLFVALAVAAVTGVVFGAFPELDIWIARRFADIRLFDWAPELSFHLRLHPDLQGVREAAMWLVTVIVAPFAIALIVKLVLPATRLLVSGRAALFLLLTLALGPGLFVNTLMKDNWGRPRPVDIPEFGGSEPFKPWWDPRGICPKNCSFVAGDASGAFWTLAPAALTPAPWRPVAYAAALAFGLGVGALRVMFGGHFVSDVLFSGVFTFLIIWLMHGLIYRWRSTRISDAAIEAAMQRLTLPAHRAVVGWFGRAVALLRNRRADRTL
jgi:membrane-associated PAP2 superfamily phosphatase